MNRTYSKDSTQAKQVLNTVIQADKETVFNLLATSEGISSWFPQLSLDDDKDASAVLFDMGDGTFEKMALLDFTTNEAIAFEWSAGKVDFKLEDTDNGTSLTLTETLPIDFTALPQDFTGWYVQMLNVKSVAEDGESKKIDKEEIKAIRKEIEETLIN